MISDSRPALSPTPPGLPEFRERPLPGQQPPTPPRRNWRWLRLLSLVVLALAIVGTGTALAYRPTRVDDPGV